jgi:hypothetical protein
MTPLIGVEDILKITNLAILTGRLKNPFRPVSELLISDVDMGKTQILEIYMNLEQVIWANDLSAKPIVTEVAQDRRREDAYHYPRLTESAWASEISCEKYHNHAQRINGGRTEECSILRITDRI